MGASEPLSAAPWIASLVLLPLVASCALLLLRRGATADGPAAAAAAVLLAVGLAREVLRSGVVGVDLGGWPMPLGIRLQADGLSAGMVLLAASVVLPVSWHAVRDVRGYAAGEASGFFPLWLFLQAGLYALFLSADLFNLYVGLELLTLAAVALAALSPSPAAAPSALRYLFAGMLGSLAFLFGTALVYGVTGTLSLAGLSRPPGSQPPLAVAGALLTAGLAMKAALVPLHYWLPAAHANAAAPVSALLSALVVKAAFYVLLRLWNAGWGILFSPAAALIPALLATAAILWGSLQALAAERLKTLVAYSTVAQVGYLFLVFPLAASPAVGRLAFEGALLFLFSHALAKAAVFLCAGNVLHAFGHDRIADLDGCVQGLPLSLFAYAVAGVSLIGLPPSGGFAAKWMLLQAAIQGGAWWIAAVILGGSLLAEAYVFRFFSRAFRHVPETAACRRLGPVHEWPALLLALAALALGLAADPLLGLLRAGNPFRIPGGSP